MTFTISSAITTATVVTIGPINTATIQIDDVSFVATHITPFLDVTVQVTPVISTTVEAIQVDTIISTDSTETLLSSLSFILFTAPETISTLDSDTLDSTLDSSTLESSTLDSSTLGSSFSI